MDKKKVIGVLVVVLLLTSLLAVAQEDEEQSPCSGFWGSLSCFWWGNPENRAGKGWFEGRNVVGVNNEKNKETLNN